MINRRTIMSGLAATMALPAFAPLLAKVPVSSGYLPVNDGRIFFMRLGKPGKTPLVMLHGGPGAGYRYLEPMARALADEREVILYDQLGCGLSDAPEDPAIYTVARYAEELQRLRDWLGLQEIMLFGNSWGTMLAIEYLTGAPRSGVKRLILSGALASVPQASAGMQRLIDALPGGKGKRLHALEAAGQQNSREYAAIAQLFYDRHVYRHTGPTSPAWDATAAVIAKSPAYRIMNGPNEFTIIGSMKDWDRRSDLGRITVPTLLTTGEFDEVTLDCHETIRDGIKGSRLVVLPGQSHVTMLEDVAGYTKLVRDFLNEEA